MALADLRALAVPRVSPVSPTDSARGNTRTTQKTPDFCGFPECVSPVSPVSPEFGNTGGGELSAPSNDPAPLSPSDGRAAALVGAYSDPDVLTDRAAIVTEVGAVDRVAVSSVPVADMVDVLAEVLAANPAHRITDRETAMVYFRGQARNRLAGLSSEAARGLLLGFERHRSAMVVHSSPSR